MSQASALTLSRRERLHRRAIRLEWFTITWNVVEAAVAIGVGIAAGSVALVGFGVDSGIETVSAVALLWRLRRAGPRASAAEESTAERRALLIVAATFFALAAYITVEAVGALARGESPESSTVGVALAAASLAVMPTLAYLKQRTAGDLGSQALRADAVETWVCAYLSLALLGGVGLYAAAGWEWADPMGALAMVPVVLWQGWETLEDARAG